jgi:hypothetical protein
MRVYRNASIAIVWLRDARDCAICAARFMRRSKLVIAHWKSDGSATRKRWNNFQTDPVRLDEISHSRRFDECLFKDLTVTLRTLRGHFENVIYYLRI